MANIIITRHKATVQWLNSQGIYGTVIDHVDNSNAHLLIDNDVYGAIPYNFAAKCNSITTVELPDLPKELRGKELTFEQLNKYAHLETYSVKKGK
jgi:putative CRISPR-associated protein (TIGR02620 family)